MGLAKQRNSTEANREDLQRNGSGKLGTATAEIRHEGYWDATDQNGAVMEEIGLDDKGKGEGKNGVVTEVLRLDRLGNRLAMYRRREELLSFASEEVSTERNAGEQFCFGRNETMC